MAGNVASAWFGPKDRLVKGSPSLSEMRTMEDCQSGSTEENILEQAVWVPSRTDYNIQV